MEALLAYTRSGLIFAAAHRRYARLQARLLGALMAAEELGVTAANADEMAKNPPNPNVARLLGAEGALGEMLGLDKDFALRAIKAQGNYAEIFNKNIGPDTPIGLERGLNASYKDGGLIYSPPFR